MAIVLAEDTDQLARVRSRLVPRKARRSSARRKAGRRNVAISATLEFVGK